jgi:hypothetical protein
MVTWFFCLRKGGGDEKDILDNSDVLAPSGYMEVTGSLADFAGDFGRVDCGQ